MLRKILTPDKNTKTMHIYHASSKLIIPGLIASSLSPWIGFTTFNFINIGFHSYISISSVITDYIHKIPIKNIEYPARFINLKLHKLACIGFLIYVNNHNKTIKTSIKNEKL
tara:strand:- start:751 stop:1086 length:336 start_codon:yes stop_codon:yes gene_type:complete